MRKATLWVGAWGLTLIATVGCRTQPRDEAIGSVEPGSTNTVSTRSAAEIAAFCGDCHNLPHPASFPRSRWAHEVRQGYDFYLESGRDDLVRPLERDAVEYFASKAPETLPIERVSEQETWPTAVRFEQIEFPPGVFDQKDPAIAHLLWREEQRAFLASDMRSGRIYWLDFSAAQPAVEVVGQADHPCRVVPWPVGNESFLVGDLGSFLPADHAKGSVRLVSSAGTDPAKTLLTGLARVVEAQPFDADGDGILDVVVAEFGWRQSGALRLLRASQEGTYHNTVLDERHGAVAVRVADLDGDNRDDVIAAFGQEHETIDVYWNDGAGMLTHQTIFALPDPSWGSSGFELVDMDGDGLMDVLHANGDTLDSGLAKPYHGIRLLRNRGNRSFENTEVGQMVGACQATAADIDQDGDLDIVACSLFQDAKKSIPGSFDGIAWFEQDGAGEFRRHSILRDTCEHVAFGLADIDGDSRTDIVAGVWGGEETGRARPMIVAFKNVLGSYESGRNGAAEDPRAPVIER